MTDRDVVESFNNAWRTLAKQYQRCPDECIKDALNLLSKIIGKVNTEVEESHREVQISIDEWISMLNRGTKWR